MWHFAYGSTMGSATLRGRRGIAVGRAVAARVPGWRVVSTSRRCSRLARRAIHSRMLVATVGLALVVPNVVAALALAVLLIALELQVRWVEEPYLARAHGPSCRAYAARTGRFVPGCGRL